MVEIVPVRVVEIVPVRVVEIVPVRVVEMVPVFGKAVVDRTKRSAEAQMGNLRFFITSPGRYRQGNWSVKDITC